MAEQNLGKVAITTAGAYDSSVEYGQLTIVTYGGESWLSRTTVPVGNPPSEDSDYWQLILSPKIERKEMTSTSASINPNTFYVWGEVASLDITLNDGASAEENRYMFQFRNPKSGATVLTLPDDILWSVDTELGDDGLPLFGKGEYTRIEIIEGLASVKKWALPYIIFADAEVERVLLAKGVGDGTGITKQEAAATASDLVNLAFMGNTVITTFNELKYFTQVTTIPYSSTHSSASQEGFKNCTALQEVTLPPSCVDLRGGDKSAYGGVGAFFGCTSLKKVNGSSQVKNIGGCSFYNCVALTTIDLQGVESIGGYAFHGCEALAIDLTGLLSKVTNLYLGTFYNTKVTGTLSMPLLESIQYGNIQRQAFESADLTRIENLGKITTIPAGYNRNYPGVFGKNVNLTYVILPSTLESIGAYTFYGDTSLQTVICDAVTPPTLGASVFEATNSTFTIYVPDASVEAYKTATNWSTYAAQIKGISELPTE